MAVDLVGLGGIHYSHVLINNEASRNTQMAFVALEVLVVLGCGHKGRLMIVEGEGWGQRRGMMVAIEIECVRTYVPR